MPTTGVSGDRADHDIIAALATPEGPGTLALVRLSGAGAWHAVRRFIAGNIVLRARHPERVLLRWSAGSLPASGKSAGSSPPVPALVVPFAAVAAYTGEETIEIYVPSSPPLVRSLLESLQGAGIRPAEPGEFTRRAFLAGRLDLTQAESVAALIAAEDLRSAAAARHALDGVARARLDAVAGAIADLIARLEAGLDFSEQEVEPPRPEALAADVAAIAASIAELLAGPALRAREAARLRVLIWGRVNAGKSTLFNRLLGRPAAITSPAAGTTRDPVAGVLHSATGTPIELLDLAGLSETADAIDVEAIGLGHELVAGDDLVLYVIDGTAPPAGIESEWALVTTALGARAWPVVNKVDVRAPRELGIDPRPIHCSALTGVGVETLRERLFRFADTESWDSRGAALLFTERQRVGLASASAILDEARRAAATPELAVIDLRRARSELDEVSGAITTDEILDRIFSRFCLGK